MTVGEELALPIRIVFIVSLYSSIRIKLGRTKSRLLGYVTLGDAQSIYIPSHSGSICSCTPRSLTHILKIGILISILVQASGYEPKCLLSVCSISV